MTKEQIIEQIKAKRAEAVTKAQQEFMQSSTYENIIIDALDNEIIDNIISKLTAIQDTYKATVSDKTTFTMRTPIMYGIGKQLEKLSAIASTIKWCVQDPVVKLQVLNVVEPVAESTWIEFADAFGAPVRYDARSHSLTEEIPANISKIKELAEAISIMLGITSCKLHNLTDTAVANSFAQNKVYAETMYENTTALLVNGNTTYEV